VDSPVDQELRQRIEQEQVVEFESGNATPSEDDLRSVAGAMNLDYVALHPAMSDTRTFFGGLVREGRGVEPRAGAFPLAVSRSSLVAVYGRLYPKTVERLRAGYCDIPGTQATVRVHADCRIVLLPEENPARSLRRTKTNAGGSTSRVFTLAHWHGWGSTPTAQERRTILPDLPA
jgi:hypothetical protein